MKTGFGELPIEPIPGTNRARIVRSDREHCRAAADDSNASKLSPYDSQLEADYAGHLELLKLGGEIVNWWYAPVRFRLPGERNTYKADFFVQVRDPLLPIEVHEVKGWSKNRRDGMTKLKTAAGLMTWARFFLITRDAGGWQKESMAA